MSQTAQCRPELPSFAACPRLIPSPSFPQWLKDPGPRNEKRTLFCDMVCFLFITPLAAISGWLCLRGAQDHLQFNSRLEAIGLIALTIALFTIYVLWTLVSASCQGPAPAPASWEHWLTPHQCHLLFLPPRVRTPWALPLECPFSYLHVQAENGKSPPGHLLSRLCSPSVRTQPATEMPELGWGWAGSGSGPSVVQEKTQTWAVQATSKMEHI